MTVSITLSHHPDCEYGKVFTNLEARILSFGTKIGYITAVLVNRKNIPINEFLSFMDGHSRDMQCVGLAIYEPKIGRTRLSSLANHDDPNHAMVLIRKFHVDEGYKKDGSSDVGASALYQFIHHPYIRGTSKKKGKWKVSSIVYELDAEEAMTPEEVAAQEAKAERDREEQIGNLFGRPAPPETEESRRKKKEIEDQWKAWQRADANHFLRNGFFQDAALARDGYPQFLVASPGQWGDLTTIKTHADASGIEFYRNTDADPPSPVGKDSELKQYVMRFCGENGENPSKATRVDFQRNVESLIQDGASVVRSYAVHAAVANNNDVVVQYLLGVDRSALNARDTSTGTPLMVAAASAAGRCNKDGIDDTQVIDMLVSFGADKTVQDKEGMTAYGHWKKSCAEYDVAIRAMTGHDWPPSARKMMTTEAVSNKLMPPDGPSAGDETGGNAIGFVQFDD